MLDKEQVIENILEVKSLVVGFDNGIKKVEAIRNISFNIRRGETVGIVGESGSGKSVMSLSIMKLLSAPPAQVSGELNYLSPQKNGSIDLVTATEKQMRQIRGKEIAMIFQEPMTSLNPVYTCGTQVMEAISLHEHVSKKEAKERTIALFKRVRLDRPEAIFNSYPHQISGGQKQRVMIAMALSCKPSLLIADEPTTALDVTVQATILELMNELRHDKDTSTIFITHDLGVVAEIADRVMVMYKGEIVEQGTVWDIFSKPQHPYTKGLLACRPRLDIKLRTLPVISDFMQVKGDGTTDTSEVKFQSVGQALMMSYQSGDELRARHDQLVAQTPILSVRNLKTYFPVERSIFGKPKEFMRAVDDVSFDVYPGEILGVVGESGCGKTTLSRTILRLVDATEGQIFFNGIDITKLGENQIRKMRRDIQIVFQDPYGSLNPRMSIGDAIMEPMRVHHMHGSDKDRKEKTINLLEKVDISATKFHSYPHELSGGQRQRVCIARALGLEPKFLICDESVSALDVSVQAQVLNLLNKLKDDFNLTYMFISHDLAVVKFIADRVMVMNQGKIEEIRFAEDLYQKPDSPYTKLLLDAIPKGDLEDIRRAQMKRRMQKMEADKRKKQAADDAAGIKKDS